jgi:hypothetical protein
MEHLTAISIVKLMRKHRKTIRGLAGAMNITQARVRQVRSGGVAGKGFVQDWMQGITGDHQAGWAAVAQAYL